MPARQESLARACPGHPRLETALNFARKDVGGRNKSGHPISEPRLYAGILRQHGTMCLPIMPPVPPGAQWRFLVEDRHGAERPRHPGESRDFVTIARSENARWMRSSRRRCHPARPVLRAARQHSPHPSTTMSPTLIPMRNSIPSAAPAFRSAMLRWTFTAQRRASTTPPNSTSKPSPVVLTSRP